jgi:pilus assembly protein Flp/PilA
MQFVNTILINLLARIQDKRDEAGQTLVEYGLILALISIVAIGALGIIGGNVKDVFNSIGDSLKGS